MFCRPKRFTLKAYKRGWVSCRDGVLRIHSSREAAGKGEPPSYAVELRGAEVRVFDYLRVYNVTVVDFSENIVVRLFHWSSVR